MSLSGVEPPLVDARGFTAVIVEFLAGLMIGYGINFASRGSAGTQTYTLELVGLGGSFLYIAGLLIFRRMVGFLGLFAGAGIGLIAAATKAADGERLGMYAGGGCLLAIALLWSALLAFAMRRRQHRQRLLLVGVLAIGTIQSIMESGTRTTTTLRVYVRVWIEPCDGSPPYLGRRTDTIPQVVVPFVVGQRYPVVIDPQDRGRFVLFSQIDGMNTVPPHIRGLWDFLQSVRAHRRVL